MHAVLRLTELQAPHEQVSSIHVCRCGWDAGDGDEVVRDVRVAGTELQAGWGGARRLSGCFLLFFSSLPFLVSFGWLCVYFVVVIWTGLLSMGNSGLLCVLREIWLWQKFFCLFVVVVAIWTFPRGNSRLLCVLREVQLWQKCVYFVKQFEHFAWEIYGCCMSFSKLGCDSCMICPNGDIQSVVVVKFNTCIYCCLFLLPCIL